MLKKYLIGLFIIGVLTSSYLYVSKDPSVFSYSEAECPFCDRKILDYQKFYEDDVVLALYTHKPVLPGHALIIPKRHIQRFEMLSGNEMLKIHQVILKVHQAVSKVFGTSSYLILQKNGREAGQSVPHVHFHYIPKKPGDYSSLKFLFHFYISAFKSPIPAKEMKRVIDLLKQEMEQEKPINLSFGFFRHFGRCQSPGDQEINDWAILNKYGPAVDF